MKAKGRKTSLLIFSIQYIFQKFGSTPSTDMHHLASYICAFIILKVLLISKLTQLQSNIRLELDIIRNKKIPCKSVIIYYIQGKTLLLNYISYMINKLNFF